MSMQNIYDVVSQHLFSSVDEMTVARIPEVTQKRLIRLRAIYNFWLQFPRKTDLEIVEKLQHDFGLARTQAYEDVRVIKAALGEMNKTTKDFHRYKFLQMIDRTFAMAERNKDARAMAAAANHYGKYTQLDKEDAHDKGYSLIVPQNFEPTDDPSVIGIKPIPNIREKIRKKLAQYRTEDIEDVEFEEADYKEDDVFAIPPIKKENDETVL